MALNSGMVVNIVVNYGGKWDIIEVMCNIVIRVVNGELIVEEIDESLIIQLLIMLDLLEVDLFICISGECCISNFMFWQLVYVEMYFIFIYWLEFGEESLIEVVIWFVNCECRFGCIGE